MRMYRLFVVATAGMLAAVVAAPAWAAPGDSTATITLNGGILAITVPAAPVWRYLAVAAGLVVLLLAGAALLVVPRRGRPVSRHARRPLRGGAKPIVVPPTVGAHRHERRRRGAAPVSRPARQPVTVTAITEAPYHRQTSSPDARDRLTGLANRSLFEDETQFAVDAGVQRLCLMRIGLDEFDEINAAHGREVGDQVLVAMAERVRSAVRPQDLTARLGGADFAVLFEEVDRADVNTVADRLLRTVREPLTVGEHQVSVRVSLGVAEARSTDDASRLMRHATDALATARIAVGARYEWYPEAAHRRHT